MTETAPTIVEAVGQTDVGLVRKRNEDSFVIADLTTDRWTDGSMPVSCEVGDRGVLVACSDGMGGAEAGDVASSITVDSLREHLRRASADLDGAFVSAAVEKANRDVWVAARVSGVKQMGATLSAVLIHSRTAHIASVGDSRAYIIREKRIRQITRDQSYLAALQAAGYAPEDMTNSPFRNVILQAMGTKPDVVVALGRIALRRGDTFLVCSDGLWGCVSDEELFHHVATAPSHAAACASLVELARERGGPDNITVVLARVTGASLLEPGQAETVTDTYESIQEFDPLKG